MTPTGSKAETGENDDKNETMTGKGAATGCDILVLLKEMRPPQTWHSLKDKTVSLTL